MWIFRPQYVPYIQPHPFIPLAPAGAATGTGAASLSSLIAAGSGSSAFTGSGAASLTALVGAGSGSFATGSTGAASLSALIAAGTGSFTTGATGAASLTAYAAAGVAGSGVFGTGAASLAALVARSHVPWLNTAWLYRQPITVDNGLNATSALSYYQASVSLTGAAYTSFAAHAKADGSDLRVTDSDGVTLLSFALEGIDTANSAVYLLVKVPYVAPAATKTVYVYYGNAAATSTSSYATTVGPTTAIVGPTDEYTQSDTANFNANEVAVLLKNQGGVNGGGAGLNGKILCFLLAGANSNGDRTNGSLAVMSSTDGGVTWGGKAILIAHTATNMIEPRSIVEEADGTLLLVYSTDTFANSSAGKARFYVAKSTDGGATWSNLSITAPANAVTVPWTFNTNIGAPYGRMIEKTAGGDLYLPVYGILTGDTGWHSWLLKCPSGSDPTNGSNWVTQGTIAFDNVNKFSEPSIVATTDSSHYLAILRNDVTCDLYSCTSADSGATWTTPTAFGLPGIVVNSIGAAVSPELIRLASGNLLLCWGVRYGSDYGSTAAAISTDGGATWLDRAPYATTTGNTATLWDGGYPTAVQNADGTICVLAYRNTGALATCNVFRFIVTEDYVCNVNNVYDGCESFGAWASHGANATISPTHAHNGTNAVKIDNSAATGGTGDTATLQAWSANTAKATGKIAVSFWKYQTANDTNDAFKIIDSTDSLTTPTHPRILVDVFGNNSQHIEWNNGTAYQDTGVAVPLNQWNKQTVRANVGPSSLTGQLLVNNVSATAGLGQANSGAAPLYAYWIGASTASTHNVIYWVDDVYTHQYTPNRPLATAGTEQAFSPPPTFTAPSSGAASLAALTALGAGAFTTAGLGAASLVTLVAAGSAGSGVFGSGAASLTALTALGAGAFTARGTGAASLVSLVAAGSGTFSSTGGGGDLLVYPDPFGATVVMTADPFGSTVVIAIDPFTATAKLKGN